MTTPTSSDIDSSTTPTTTTTHATATASPLSDEQRQRILDAVDAAFDQQVAFTQELVRHPSLRANESSAQDLLYGAMAGRGLTMDRWELDPVELAAHPGAGAVEISYEGLENVVGTFTPPQERGSSLILNGHIDVVPEGPESQWARSPWDATVRDGWLYGRGSGDMKAGLVANLYAFDAVRAAGLAPTGRIHFESVVEEECTGNGSLSAHLRGYTADAVLIPEPEEDMLVRANTGVIWLRLRVDGKPTHPREMQTGFNAIDAAYSVIGELRKLEADWNTKQGEHRYFEDLDHPINFNVGKIQGGDWGSSVPAWCEVDVRVALYPGITADAAWAEITDALDGVTADGNGNPIVTTATKTGFYAEGYVLEEGGAAERALERSHSAAFGGAELESFVTPGYLDGRVFVQYADTPALVYGPISEAIHGYDERVNLESVRRITKSIALFIAEWCGVE
ncbi:acetylornithine deacetylase [Pseudoclavibacter sp. RFBJ3]|uniref:ArgE/DapE family deacylase n=1 Tax=unclassified Pseudoclavibacter TaxID=2615177 RepID=UPI000CE8D2CB|nr:MULTISPECIES: ArgE/DapE family deacylase [unclassified Pseudoclavibacter]PPF80888.1 acetylornithine deacetylase [Pseudoclavibacter sp. RFBJ5]PPF94397.1 acetylornithine deacetylase [Pseudoclavibacter sp. RFBJ3]PPF99504.1 acetylornithine deacetylase [Pseudoclavibacter sp. RFBH5]PPG25698.1 acetylornithine deacetylase [Pseudoclavibacter sp. RFBI4]